MRGSSRPGHCSPVDHPDCGRFRILLRLHRQSNRRKQRKMEGYIVLIGNFPDRASAQAFASALLALPVETGLPAYLEWIGAQTREADA